MCIVFRARCDAGKSFAVSERARRKCLVWKCGFSLFVKVSSKTFVLEGFVLSFWEASCKTLALDTRKIRHWAVAPLHQRLRDFFFGARRRLQAIGH